MKMQNRQFSIKNALYFLLFLSYKIAILLLFYFNKTYNYVTEI